MSNVIVQFSNTGLSTVSPSIVRNTFSRISYSDQSFFTYALDEGSSFDPAGKGAHFFSFFANDDTGSGIPDFTDDDTWEKILKKNASGFVTAVNSVMPKLFIPSKSLVTNGVLEIEQTNAINADGSYGFNWNYDGVTGGAQNGVTGIYAYGKAGKAGEEYAVSKYKDDTNPETEVKWSLDEPLNPPVGDWDEGDSYVGGGALAIYLNVQPTNPASASSGEPEDFKWGVEFQFGEVTIGIKEGGGLEALIAGSDKVAKVNLPEARGKEGMPQQNQLKEGIPYLILVYPVWNGVVVSAGIQDSTSVVDSASAYAIKTDGASIFESPYSNGFDTLNPADVNVGTNSDVLVDFGTTMSMDLINCRARFAYAPCFFSRRCWFDEWFIGPKSNINSAYTFDVYSIYTDNNTSFNVNSPSVSNEDSIDANSEYKKISWRITANNYSRWAGELFGSVLETTESTLIPVLNGNGNYVLTWSGGVPQDPNPTTWTDYIQNVNVSIGIDGSSGEVSVDKHGVAGANAIADQNVGLFRLSATGGDNTTPGEFFIGLGIGVNDSIDSSGGVWSIPLVGLEQKMNDIALVNSPFFDGYTLSAAATYLSQYGGIGLDLSRANGSVQLSSSTNLSTPVFDFKSGTSVFDALTAICEDTQHHFIVMDGIIHLFELGSDGLPTTTGTIYTSTAEDFIQENRSPDFTNVRNQIIVLGLQEVTEGSGKEFIDIPQFPRIVTVANSTNPSFPWAKAIVRGIPGLVNKSKMEDIADTLAALTSKYDILGSTTIEGNALIRPYDTYNGLFINNVTHNIDIPGKTWTTDLEFSGN